MVKLDKAAILLLCLTVSCTETETIPVADRTREVYLSTESGAGTRTSLGPSNSVLWTAYDYISVLDGVENRFFELTDGSGTTSATFRGEVSESATELYAISPYQVSATLDGGVVSGLSIPSMQSPCEGTYDPSSAMMCARSSGTDESLHFHNITAYLKFTPTFTCSEVTVKALGGEKLSGGFSVEISSDGLPSDVITDGSATDTVSMSGMPIESGRTYMIGAVPTTLQNGFTMTFTAEDGKKYSRTKHGEVILKAGRILDLGTFSRDGTWDASGIESVTLSRRASGILQGCTLQLTASVLPSSASSTGLEWKTSDRSVATVSQDGTVTALAPGTCQIIASEGSVSDTCSIAVVASSQSVYRHGYSQLSSEDRKAYEYMLSRIAAFEDNASQYGDVVYNRVYLDFASIGYSPTYDKVQRLTNLISKDVPEAYPLGSYIYRYDSVARQYYLRLIKSYTPEKYVSQMAAIYSTGSQMVSEATGESSEYGMAKSLHDSLVRNANYGDMTGVDAGTIVGGLINGRIVCEGYSRTYLFLCQQAGLKAIYVVGALQTSSVNDTWTNHAWNHVSIDGSWYMTDVTCDGGLVGSTIGYSNFMLGETSSKKIHSYLYTDGSDGNVSSIAYESLPELSQQDYCSDTKD